MSNGFPWFRLYANEMLGDRKMKRIHKLTGISKAEIRGVWVSLLCLASESPERGMLLFDGGVPYDYDDLVEECGLDSLKFHTLFMHFQKMGMVAFIEEDGIYYLPAWAKRQPVSDTTGAKRVREHRERKKETVTLQKRYSNALEQEQEEDKDSEKETTIIGDGNVFSHYENHIATLNDHMRDEIGDYIDRCPNTWLIEAMNIAVDANVRKWSYVRGILENWLTNGKQERKKENVGVPAVRL